MSQAFFGLIYQKNNILLRCDSEVVPKTIAGGYISEREQRILILSSKKIKLQNIILKKR